MTLPSVISTGTYHETDPAFGSHAAQDLALLITETASGLVTTTGDWTLLGSIANSTNVTATVYYQLVDSGSEPVATLGGGTDHKGGIILVIRGADLNDPIADVAISASITGGGTTGFMPGLETEEVDCLIVNILAWAVDNAGPIASAEANASLANLTERHDGGTTTLGGGGLIVYTGERAAIGIVSPTTNTITTTTYAAMSIAIRPPVTPPAVGLQLSEAARNALLNAIETEGGTSAILKIRTGAPPATCATADSGTVLVTASLPSDYMAAASGGAKAKSGTWEDTSADNSGTAGHFRLYKSDGTTCFIQGTVTASGGGGDLTLTTTTITAGDSVTITTFTITAPGA